MDPAAPAHPVDRAVEVFGVLDVLVNNVGGPPPGTVLPHVGFLTPTDDDRRAMIEFNLLAPSARSGPPSRRCRRAAAARSSEFGPQGIRVNTVSPGQAGLRAVPPASSPLRG